MDWKKRDHYGRIVGKILLADQDVCLEQVRAGLAWHYQRYQNEQSLQDREAYAQGRAGCPGRQAGAVGRP